MSFSLPHPVVNIADVYRVNLTRDSAITNAKNVQLLVWLSVMA